MTLWEIVGLWSANFIQVFLYGFQSRNVNNGHYLYAAGGSFCLAVTSILLVKSQASLPFWWLLGIIGTSGPLGIVMAMLFWQRLIGNRHNKT